MVQRAIVSGAQGRGRLKVEWPQVPSSGDLAIIEPPDRIGLTRFDEPRAGEPDSARGSDPWFNVFPAVKDGDFHHWRATFRPQNEMLNPRTHNSYGFRPPSDTGRSCGTLAPSCGVLAQSPQAYRANSTARVAALSPSSTPGFPRREHLDE